MSGRAPELANRLTRGWVRVYTRGLPADLRAARRDELESDLWEHAHSSAIAGRRSGQTALEIVGRLAAGMGADISWRLEHRPSRRPVPRPLGGGTMIEGLKRHGMAALTVAYGVAMSSLAVAVTAFGDVERAQTALLFVAGLLMLAGVVAVHRGLRGGRPAVALGAIIAGLMLVWSIVTPIVSLVILVWLVAGRQTERAPVLPA